MDFDCHKDWQTNCLKLTLKLRFSFNSTLALLRTSSTATKEREAAEKARREAEDRAAGIEPREFLRDERKDERTERPKIVWFKPV